MVTFTETTFHELLDSDKTTPSTVLDSDGKLKQSLHNLIPNTDIADPDTGFNEVGATLVQSGTSPSGEPAYLITENTNTNVQHRIYKAPAVKSGRYYGISIDVKRGSGSRNATIYLGAGGYGSAVRWNLDLDDGTIENKLSGTKDAAIATKLTDGWWNFTLYAQATADTSPAFSIALASGSNIQYNGDGTSGIYVSRVRMYEASVHAPVERVTNGTFDSDVSGWTKEGTTSHTLTYSSGAALLTKDASSSADDVFSQTSIPTVSGETYRISFKAKKVSGQGAARLRVVDQVGGGTLYNYAYITDTSYVTITDTFTAAGVGVHVYIHCGGGANAGSVEFDDITLTKVIDDGIQNDLDGEDFIETSGSAIYHGGLEYNGDGSFRGIQSFEGRTNLVLRGSEITGLSWATSWGSGTTGTLNAIASPSGEFDASKIDTTDGTGDGTQQGVSGLTIDNYYTASVFLKNDDANRTDILFYNNSTNEAIVVNWSGSDISSVSLLGSNTSNARYEDYGDGWYRVSFTVQVKATSGSFVVIPENDGSNTTGSVYAWGAQFEAGSSPSPYIPTTGSTRSRNGDKLHKPLSEFGYNHDEVTVKVEFESAGTDGNDYPRAFQLGGIDNTSHSERHDVYYDRVAGALVAVNRTNDSNTSYLSLGTGPTNQLVKVMVAFKKDDYAASDDGDTVVTDTSGDMATVDTLFLGNQRISDSLLNGYIKKLIFWPKRLANATLEAESE